MIAVCTHAHAHVCTRSIFWQEVNHCNALGQTALTIAAALGFQELVPLLIEHQADANVQVADCSHRLQTVVF